jgi:hypothetical protein
MGNVKSKRQHRLSNKQTGTQEKLSICGLRLGVPGYGSPPSKAEGKAANGFNWTNINLSFGRTKSYIWT